MVISLLRGRLSELLHCISFDYILCFDKYIYIIFEITTYGKKTYSAKFPISQSYRSRYASLIPQWTFKHDLI